MKRRTQRFGNVMTKVSALLGLVALLASAPARPAAADEEPTPALTTDRKDYSPGEIVTISGFNFVPGEVVTIAVQGPSRPDRFVESVADASGSFTNTDFSPDQGDVEDFLKAVATGSASGPDRTAVAYFYDSTPPGPCPYVVDGSLSASNPSGSKFKTIQEAVTALPNPGPCTINIKAGTYREAVSVNGVNSAAGASSASEVVIQPDPSNVGPVMVTAPGSADNATTSHAFSFQGSNFVRLTGLTISGSARSAIRFIANPKNGDITIDGNDIASNNASGSASTSAVDIGNSQTRIWVVNNLVRNNGRWGINVAAATGPIYIINNTIVGNLSGGVARAGGSTPATVSFVNNLVVGNGWAPNGQAQSCACGLTSGNGASGLVVKNNMFLANGNGSSSSTDIDGAATILDSGDTGNYVTCTGSGTGCTAASPANLACTFADCKTHPLTDLFVSTADFHLKTSTPVSPGIDRGLNSFKDPSNGPDWVPAIDFYGDDRPQDGDGTAGSVVDIGFLEAPAAVHEVSTAVSLSSSKAVSAYGDQVMFTATVTSGANPVPAGSGTVSFYDGASCGGNQIGATQTVGASGQTSVSASNLSVAAHTITACYSGVAGSFSASTGSVVQTVNKADQAITVTQDVPTSAAYNATFTVAATGGASGEPVLVAASGACSASGNTITMTSGTGTCTVTFNQAGNGNYNAAPQLTRTATAQKADQAIAVTQDVPPTAVYKTTFAVAATGGASGQAVVVAASGACSAAGSTITMISGTGVCSVTFNQAGDANYNAAPQVTRTTNAAKADQAITVTQGAPTTAVYASQFTVAATGGPSGQAVTVAASGACSASGNTITMTSGTGTCTVTFNQAGDANYNAAPQVAQATTAVKAPQTIDFAPLGTKNFGDPSFPVNATATSTLTVLFSSQTPDICNVTGNTVKILHSGFCTIVASQAGDNNYSAAPDVPQSVGINMGPSTLWLGLKNSDDQGTQFDVRVEVYEAGTTPEKLVGFGEAYCITGVTRNQQAAKLVTVPMSGFGADKVYVKILTRIGSKPDGGKCSGHSSATGLRLYFDSTSQPSQIGDAPLYLHAGQPERMNTAKPTTVTAAYEDSPSIKTTGSGNPWVVVGSGWQQ